MDDIKEILVTWFLSIVLTVYLVASLLVLSGFFDDDGWWRDDEGEDDGKPPPNPGPLNKKDVERIIEEMIKKAQDKLKINQ